MINKTPEVNLQFYAILLKNVLTFSFIGLVQED